jgi:hypothetical protein
MPAVREAYRLGNTAIKLGSFDELKNGIWSMVLSQAHVMACRLGVRGDCADPYGANIRTSRMMLLSNRIGDNLFAQRKPPYSLSIFS